MPVSHKDRPKKNPVNPLRQKPNQNLYSMEMVGRALDHADKIRLWESRPGSRDGRTKYTLGALSRATGITHATLRGYFSRSVMISPAALDQLMVAMNFDLLDLITPSEYAEMWQRRGIHFRHWAKRSAKCAELNIPVRYATKKPKKKLDVVPEPE